MSLDVLFINPDELQNIYGALYTQVMTIEPPVWAQMLSKAVKSKGHTSKIIDCVVHRTSLETLKDKVDVLSPRLVVITVYGQNPTASTQTMHGVSLTTAFLKKHLPSIKILLVGGHVSALPLRTMNEEVADFVAKGEGIDTILGLLQTDLDSPTHLKNVPGLWYRNSGTILQGPVSKTTPEDELDKVFPGLDHEEIDYHQYKAPSWFCLDDLSQRNNYASIYTSLGCPFKCSFCCINAPFDKKIFRGWSTKLVMDQFEVFHQRKVRNIKIADEMFVFQDDHYLETCKELAARKYNFNIWAFARVDTIKEKNLKIMKEAGISWLILGIESVSKEVREGVSKGNYNKEKIKDTIKKIHDAGIKVHANFIFGMPDDDLESMQENLDFSMEIDVGTANYYCAMALPGSELYHTAIRNNWTLPSTWSGYSQFGPETLPLPTKHLTAAEVLAFRDQAWVIYHNNPAYLDYIQRHYGNEAVNYIKELRMKKLDRNYASQKILAKKSY
jgi:anaerobic magnesium-protoporphyrin IX monomethyl ester cyclase